MNPRSRQDDPIAERRLLGSCHTVPNLGSTFRCKQHRKIVTPDPLAAVGRKGSSGLPPDRQGDSPGPTLAVRTVAKLRPDRGLTKSRFLTHCYTAPMVWS